MLSDSPDLALLDLLRLVSEAGYRFVTVTPETHRRYLARREPPLARELRDVFGWSLPFEEGLTPPAIMDALQGAGMAERDGRRWKSRVRISSLGGTLFLHSGFPTDDPHSVFLGPDSYRFAAFLSAEIPKLGPIRRLVDIGAGGGVGGIVAAGCAPGAEVVLTDINPEALRLARVNAAFAGIDARTIEGSGLAGTPPGFDLAVANPPFIIDPAGRKYRDGGDMHGARLSFDWTLEAAGALASGGAVLLYTGSPILGGRDRLREALEEALPAAGCSLAYRELDPDIFGEQLDEPGYEEVERIAAVGAVIRRFAT